MTDAEFIRAFEETTLPNELFHHRDHLRVTWLYLHWYGPAEALPRVVEGIRRFAAAKGASEKYHHTVTLAWVRLVGAAARDTQDFDGMLEAHPELLDKGTLQRYYSDPVLKSPEARGAWVEPDLAKLPSVEN